MVIEKGRMEIIETNAEIGRSDKGMCAVKDFFYVGAHFVEHFFAEALAV